MAPPQASFKIDKVGTKQGLGVMVRGCHLGEYPGAILLVRSPQVSLTVLLLVGTDNTGDDFSRNTVSPVLPLKLREFLPHEGTVLTGDQTAGHAVVDGSEETAVIRWDNLPLQT